MTLNFFAEAKVYGEDLHIILPPHVSVGGLESIILTGFSVNLADIGDGDVVYVTINDVNEDGDIECSAVKVNLPD